MKSLRWKIMLLCALLIIVPVLILRHYSVVNFDEFTRRNQEDSMINAAYMLGEAYKIILKSRQPPHGNAAQELVEFYAEKTGGRVTLIAPDGTVLADSEQSASPDENLTNFPEVQRSLNGAYGARTELTDDRQYLFYHISVPILKADGSICCSVRISRHTSEITRKILEIRRFQRNVALIIIGVGMALALLLAQTITSRLRRLARAAGIFAKSGVLPDIKLRGSDEVAEVTRAVQQMAGELQRTNKYNHEFISTVLHELKAPITAIKGATELLEQGACLQEANRVKFLGNIHFETNRLARMVGELNELTRLDTEIPRALKEKVDYTKLMAAIMERFEALEDECAPIHVCLPDTPIWTLVIPDRIHQVMDNLLTNAMRYTPAGGSIQVSVAPGRQRDVITTVRDTGCGISPANLEKVFDRYFTTEPKGETRNYGSGLGLAIAKSIIENHQGSIRVESVINQGSAFIFSLPVVEA